MNKRTGIRFAGIAALLMTQMVWAKTIYVDAAAAGSNNGTSWTNAYVYLQDALTAAVANDEIRVAAGIYRPDRGKSVTLGDRNASFVLKNLVKIMGGYPAGGGTTRNWETNKTFLSGDLNSNDSADTLVKNLLTDATRADNSYHVIYSNLCGSPTLLDGLIITGGQANGAAELGKGGGWYCITNSSPTVNKCIFTRNAATTRGGGWYITDANCRPNLSEVQFVENYCRTGGGAAMLSVGSDVTLNNCEFISNYAASDSSGGGLYLDQSSPQLTDCEFSHNYANYGGALNADNTSAPTVIKSAFYENSSSYGGAVRTYNNCNVKMSTCQFSDNTSSYGGACFFDHGQDELLDCQFYGNSSSAGGAVYVSYNTGNGTKITRSVFYDNDATDGGGAIFNYSGYNNVILTLKDCVFVANFAKNYGGAIINYADNVQGHTKLKASNCVFAGNYVTGIASCGGAVANIYSGNYRTYVNVANSIFYANTAVSLGGGLYTNIANSSTNTIDNSILWRNADTAGGTYDETAQIHGGANTIRYCCIQGLDTYAGNGNINSDPLFANPLGEDWVAGTPDDNLRLTKGSPCVDAGNNTLVPAELTTDLDGMPRFWDDPDMPNTGVGANPGDPIVDMGAYELNLQGPVAFCDANLKAAVEAALGITDPTPNDMLNLTSLTATGKNIACLGGLEYALNLTSLNLTSNKIVDISPLKNLPLQSLYLGGNQLGSGDWQATIAALTSLKSLYLHSNGLISIPSFCEQTNLQNLYLYSNKIADLCPLTDCLTKLLDLRVQSNPLQTVEWFETCVPQIKANNSSIVNFMYDPNCNLKQKADVNKDCLVNLADFAIMADEWLTCDYIYQQLCP